ncbi:MAG: hypothetical protein NXI24_07465 [bacterium]|nr:hypothetical protein [bacterium]
MQTASWYAWPPIDTLEDRRAARRAARESFERARRIFDRYEAALFWPPGMLLSAAGNWWGLRIWAGYCRDFLNLGEPRWTLSFSALAIICACGLRGLFIRPWPGAPGGAENVGRSIGGGAGLLRQVQVVGLAMLLAQSRDAGRNAVRAIEKSQSIDTAKFKAEEGVCYE